MIIGLHWWGVTLLLSGRVLTLDWGRRRIEYDGARGRWELSVWPPGFRWEPQLYWSDFDETNQLLDPPPRFDEVYLEAEANLRRDEDIGQEAHDG